MLDAGRPLRPADRPGRTLISRAELARSTGLSTSSLAGLYTKWEDSGHPSAVYIDPRRGALYFDEEEALRWDRCRRREVRDRARRFANCTGNADDLVTTDEAARILGYHGPATI